MKGLIFQTGQTLLQEQIIKTKLKEGNSGRNSNNHKLIISKRFLSELHLFQNPFFNNKAEGIES
ncbi:hypothetical protein P872_12150 [Rhodonellum psychrophilum GCM71 = DSM 17998]|uniref:Uncharacterized protein n=1 Tax=Rhodonellum psychrophilum GCM71 = DSM 17998 TaxID=1123057 RepID=U5BTT0_9BACT|nr:hypothetical protein P872_12150 [Rhodonellum psychrophilum GCM71 = DSM 17998]